MRCIVGVLLAVAACGSPVCHAAQVPCGNWCVDLSVDPSHCGACDHACGTGDVCSLATCAGTCLGGLSECNGLCVDASADPSHCGSCGNACSSDSVCASAACSPTCAPHT